jgi:hypothetical protein
MNPRGKTQPSLRRLPNRRLRRRKIDKCIRQIPALFRLQLKDCLPARLTRMSRLKFNVMS